MPIKTAIQSDNLTTSDNIFCKLSALAKPITAAKIKAKWSILRISPDLATGELLNVGVCVLYKKKVYVKLLPNAKPFELLYGVNGKENFSFFLKIIGQFMRTATSLSNIKISPQVSISPSKFVAGDSIDEILNRLYASMVILDGVCSQKQNNRTSNISTETFRNKIQQSLTLNDKDYAKRIWHNNENPILIPEEWGESNTITDVQLLVPADYVNSKVRFASFVSLDYQNLDFAQLYLLQAEQGVQCAAASISKIEKEAALFIYRPDSKVSNTIDNLLDRSHWLLRKQLKNSFRMEVESSIEKISQQTKAFIM